MNPCLPAFVLFHAVAVLAQEAPKSAAPQVPAPALAVDVVRQRVEGDRLRPPAAQNGLEPGDGAGPLVLIVRRADGGLVAHEVRRGEGDRGAVPTIGQMAIETTASDTESPTVRLAWVKESVVAARGGSEKVLDEWCRGPQLDAAALRPRLTAMLAAAKTTPHAGQLQIDAAPEVPTQHVLTLWEIARSVGFKDVMFGPLDPKKAVPATSSELLRGLAVRFQWPTRKVSPDSEHTICDGELMLLLDGPSPWGEITPLIQECSRAGIWRIGFVAQKDAKTFVKLPTNLLSCQGS